MPDPADPQSLNRYSYVRNNALKYVDPTGHMDDVGDYLSAGGGIRKDENGHHLGDQVAGVLHGAAELIHTYEGSHGVVHATELVWGGFALEEGTTYAGQAIVYGTYETKALAGLSTHLTRAWAATHPGLVGYTNPWVAARNAIRGFGTIVALGIVYGVDIVEYHDYGTRLTTAMAVDTVITLGLPALGAGIGTAVFPGLGTVFGTAAGNFAAAGASLFIREGIIDAVEERITLPASEAMQRWVNWQLQTGASTPIFQSLTPGYSP